MKVWGPKASGKTGVMDEDDVIAFAQSKVGVGTEVWRKNLTKAFSAISNYQWGKTSGGATDLLHNNKKIFHFSEGKVAGGQGASLFFTCEGGINASIIAIGRHASHDKKGGKSTTSYRIEWNAPSWQLSKLITLPD